MVSTLVHYEDLVPPVAMPGETPTCIAGWLEHFGKMDAFDIARYFTEIGITGTPQDPYDCAFAVFFSRVAGHRVHVCGKCVHVHGLKEHYALPQSCLSFVRMFDTGQFPRLYRSALPFRRIMPGVFLPTTSTWMPSTDVKVEMKVVTDAMSQELAKLSEAYQVPAEPVQTPELVSA